MGVETRRPYAGPYASERRVSRMREQIRTRAHARTHVLLPRLGESRRKDKRES